MTLGIHNRATAQRCENSGLAPYGFCPECKRVASVRERRPNGDDFCIVGHKYPSAKALKALDFPSGDDRELAIIRAALEAAAKVAATTPSNTFSMTHDYVEGLVDGHDRAVRAIRQLDAESILKQMEG